MLRFSIGDCAGAEQVQMCKRAEVGVEQVQTCRMQICRYRGVEVQRC
jgi:hypothetical protein